MSRLKLPPLPPGGLTAAQLLRFVEEASRAYWEGVASNGLDALLDFHLRATCRKQFSVLWDAYNTQDAIPKSEDGGISHTSDEVLPWLDFQKFSPGLRFFREDPIQGTIDRIKEQAFHATKAHVLWEISRGIVADYRGGKLAGYSLIRSPYPPTDEYIALQTLSAEALEAEYLKNANTSFYFPFTYKIKGGDGKPYTGSASIGVRLELCRDLDKEAYRLRSHVGIEFTPPPPWDVDPLAFWNAAEEAMDGLRPNIFLPDLDWGHYISAAILAEPGEPTDPNQMEMPLGAAPDPIVRVLDLATFSIPSTIKGRLQLQAFGMHVSKEQRELDRILNKKAHLITEADRKRAEEIQASIILHRKPFHNDEFEEMGETLTLKIRETQKLSVQAKHEIRSNKEDRGKAVDAFFKHFVPTFHSLGRRHVMLVLSELLKSGWRPYTFQASKHIAKLRNLKPGEAPPKAERMEAQRIIFNLCHTFLSVQSKVGDQHISGWQRFFNLENRSDVPSARGPKNANDEDKDEIYIITATEELKNLFKDDDNIEYFVPILESAIREDHQKHGLAVDLYVHFSALWRMDPVRKMSVADIFDLIGKDCSPENQNRRRDLEKLESELDYMVARNPPFLGSWSSSRGDADRPSKCRKTDPAECMLTLVEPGWLAVVLEPIRAGRRAFLAPPTAPEANNPMTRADLEAVIKASGLPSANKFAQAIGFSKGLLSETRSGKREITPALEAKIRTRFPELLPSRGRSQ